MGADVPSTFFGTFHTLCHLILTRVQQSRHHYLHFTDEETLAQKV